MDNAGGIKAFLVSVCWKLCFPTNRILSLGRSFVRQWFAFFHLACAAALNEKMPLRAID